MRGTIDGSEVFLDDDQLPAFTLSVNSVTDPGSVKGARSTTIRLTNTKELARVMGSQYLMSADFPPRTTLRIGDEGGEEFVSQIVPVAHDTFQIEAIAVGGNASWFEYAKATKIRSVDLGKTLPLTRTVQEDTWDDEESLVYFPLIDFGSLENRAATFDVGVTKLRPALRLHRLLDELMDPAGYRFVPQGRLVEVWKKWVVMDTGAKPTLGIPGPYPFDEIFSTSNPAPDGVYFIPTVDGTMDVDCVDLQINFLTSNTDFDGAVFTMVVYDETSDTILASYDVLTSWATDSSYGSYVVSHSFVGVPVVAGHNIFVSIISDSAEAPTASTITNDSATVEYDLNSGAQTLKLRPSLSSPVYAILPNELDEVYAGYPMSNARMAPDWTIEQLIKGIASVAGLVFDTVGNNINVWTDKEYFRTPNTVDEYRDWSTRTDLTRPPRLLYGEAPRIVEFKYKEDEGDEYLRRANRRIRTAEYASFKQTNEQGLQPDKTIEVPFTPSVAGTLFAGGGNTVSALVMRDTDEDYQVDNYSRGVRLFLADGLATGNWKHGGSSLTEYPLSYFSREDDVVPLPFGNANIVGDVPVGSDIQWSRMLSQMRSPRVIEIDLFIRDNEVKDFDFGMPTLVDDGSGPTWFWVQEIKQHRFGVNQPTKCVLVQIPMKEGGDTGGGSAEPDLSIAAVPMQWAGLCVLRGGGRWRRWCEHEHRQRILYSALPERNAVRGG